MYIGTRPAASPSTEASFSSTATNADHASIPTASGVARQQLCDGAQRGSDQGSRHSNVKQHEHQPANDAGASAAIPLAYFTLANIRGLKPRTVPSKVSFIQDILQHNCQLFAALTETWLQEHLDAEISIDGYTIFRQDLYGSATKAATVVV